MAYITDDSGCKIAPGQVYTRASYYGKQKTARYSQVYLLMNNVAYLYKDSIVHPYFNSMANVNNCIKIQN